MKNLVSPYGNKGLVNLVAEQSLVEEVCNNQANYKKVAINTQELTDLILIGTGAYSPLDGFMSQKDWVTVCQDMCLSDGTHWPIPITLAVSPEIANSIKLDEDILLTHEMRQGSVVVGLMKVSEKYISDKCFEAENVYGTICTEHPGIIKLLNKPSVNLAGSITLISEFDFASRFSIYMSPEKTRSLFNALNWKTVAAFQTRNPMHRSHEALVCEAMKQCDGVMIHSVLGELKHGDIPADISIKSINVLLNKYYVKQAVIQSGIPYEMRYAGPREALLHAILRQNYGCSHLIIGRDHAGAGNYYSPFAAQQIFDKLPAGTFEIKPINMDWHFWCYQCDAMTNPKQCKHSKEHQLTISGTRLRELLAQDGEIPKEFSRPEVVEFLREYYRTKSTISG